MWERHFGLRSVVRGHGERRLTQPEKAGTELLGNDPVILPGARVRAARASAATVFARGLATGDDDCEGESPEKVGRWISCFPIAACARKHPRAPQGQAASACFRGQRRTATAATSDDRDVSQLPNALSIREVVLDFAREWPGKHQVWFAFPF